MKLQLNFDKKTVTLENDVNMGEFFQWFSEKIDNWKEWTVKTNTVVEWREPIVIERHAPFIWPRPYYLDSPTVTYSSEITSGPTLTIQAERSPIVNLEVN